VEVGGGGMVVGVGGGGGGGGVGGGGGGGVYKSNFPAACSVGVSWARVSFLSPHFFLFFRAPFFALRPDLLNTCKRLNLRGLCSLTLFLARRITDGILF